MRGCILCLSQSSANRLKKVLYFFASGFCFMGYFFNWKGNIPGNRTKSLQSQLEFVSCRETESTLLGCRDTYLTVSYTIEKQLC